MPTTNYATYYAQALSQQYPNVLHFGALFARDQEGDYRFVNAHTIEVPSISVTGRVDANRKGKINEEQRHSNEWTPLVLRNHRAWQDYIHPADINETNYVLSIQNITRVFNQEQKFPEKDKYLISTLHSDWLAVGRVPFTGKLTNENILTYFDQMMTQMTEKNVPLRGRILYVTTYVETLLKNAIAFYRTANIQINNPASIQRAIANIDNVSIEVVPSDHMLTSYDFTEGAVRGKAAKQVEMLLIHPTCVITPENYLFAQLDPPSAGSQGKYYYYEEAEEDVFLLPKKQYGAEFFVSGLTTDAATFTSVAGTEQGDTKVTVTAPIGTNLKNGSRYYYAVAEGTAPAALTLGQIVPEDGEWTEWDGESDITATNGHKMTLLVTDADRRVYAAGNNTVTANTGD